MIYDEISANKRKSVFLIFVFILFISLLGYIIGLYYGNPYAGIILTGVFGFFYAIIAYFAGKNIVLTLSSAKEATKKDHAFLLNTVEGLSLAAGIPKPKVYVIDDTAINAFATGNSPKNAAITVTTGALAKLNRTELEGVLGHEMSHIKNYDIRFMLLVIVLIGILTLLSDFFLRSMIFGGRRDDDRKGEGGAIILVIGIVLAILSPIIAQFVQLAISRKREYLADASGALLTRYPQGLANALKKIRDDKDPFVDTANRATASLYISNPLRKSAKTIDSWFSTHPPLEDRINRLEKM